MTQVANGIRLMITSEKYAGFSIFLGRAKRPKTMSPVLEQRKVIIIKIASNTECKIKQIIFATKPSYKRTDVKHSFVAHGIFIKFFDHCKRNLLEELTGSCENQFGWNKKRNCWYLISNQHKESVLIVYFGKNVI